MPSQSNAELLKSMLIDFIGDRQEQSAVTLHNYFVAKSQSITGLANPSQADDDLDDDILDISDDLDDTSTDE